MKIVKKIRLSLRIIKLPFFSIIYFFEKIKINIYALRDYKAYKANRIYPDFMKFGSAVSYIRPLAKKYCDGTGLDIGASIWPVFESARIVENSYEENALHISEKDNSIDYIFSSHTLEHIDSYEDAIKEWIRVVKNQGIIFLYLPHPTCKMWLPENLDEHKWSPSPEYLKELFQRTKKLEICDLSYLPDVYHSFYIIAKVVKND